MNIGIGIGIDISCGGSILQHAKDATVGITYNTVNDLAQFLILFTLNSVSTGISISSTISTSITTAINIPNGHGHGHGHRPLGHYIALVTSTN